MLIKLTETGHIFVKHMGHHLPWISNYRCFSETLLRKHQICWFQVQGINGYGWKPIRYLFSRDYHLFKRLFKGHRGTGFWPTPICVWVACLDLLKLILKGAPLRYLDPELPVVFGKPYLTYWKPTSNRCWGCGTGRRTLEEVHQTLLTWTLEVTI